MNKTRELIVDSFAGGGGASLGISWACRREPDLAINHDASAIAMHAANHPLTVHVTEDVWKVAPLAVTKGLPIGLLWASPDCKHFSRAKGGKPVEKRIRSLAWVIVRWAAACAPRLIILENVREFEDWGPLVPRWQCSKCDWRGTEKQVHQVSQRGRVRHKCPRCDCPKLRATAEQIPDPARNGLTFNRFVGTLRGMGYEVSWKLLNAADFGAPTHRRRLFLIARNDGRPIHWPEPTHGDPRHICNAGLFGALRPWRTAAECIDWSIPCPSIFTRKRPLAEKTMRRIAMGIKRYVLENPRPFLVRLAHGDKANGSPRWGKTDLDLGSPLPTVTASKEYAIVTPYLVGAGGPSYSAKPVAADAPLGTMTMENHRALVVPYLVPRYGEADGQLPRSHAIDTPMPVVTPDANGGSLVGVFLAKHYGGSVGCEVDSPLPTTTARGTQNQLVASNLVHLNHGDKQWSGCAEPLRTLTTGGHAALVYSFLVKYFGKSFAQELAEPVPTATSKDRFGLVTVSIESESFVIADLGLRMLTPRELARAQGFPDTYVLTGSKTSQIQKIGNSVCPIMAKVLVEANYP